MKKVIFIIGLPGSGKTTLINHYLQHPFKEYVVYDDWMKWVKNSSEDKEDFTADVNYNKMIKHIQEGKNVIISTIHFCKIDFLLKSEYYLKLEFPEIHIEKIYFENNIENCINNVKYRDKVRGGHWKPNEKGEMWYYGTIYYGKPLFEKEIERIEKISEIYYIPKNSDILKIKKLNENDIRTE